MPLRTVLKQSGGLKRHLRKGCAPILQPVFREQSIPQLGTMIASTAVEAELIRRFVSEWAFYS